jgi:hypothetical protein
MTKVAILNALSNLARMPNIKILSKEPTLGCLGLVQI